MANSFNVDLDYFTHPKTQRLVGLLGKGAEVLPLRLWAYCGKYHSEFGSMPDYGVKEIESVIGWEGNPGDAVAALLKVKYLEKNGEEFRVHDWVEYQGHIHAYKVRGKNAAMKKWNAISNACGIQPASSNAASNASSINASIPLCNAEAVYTGEAFEAGGTPEDPHAESAARKAVAAKKSVNLRAHTDFKLTTPETRKLALESFNSWATSGPPVGISSGVNEFKDEHYIVWNLCEEMAGMAPVPRGHSHVSRHLLVPDAVKHLVSKNKPFKSVTWACACVRTQLGDWANEGYPLSGNGKHYTAANPPPGKSITTTQTFGKT